MKINSQDDKEIYNLRWWQRMFKRKSPAPSLNTHPQKRYKLPSGAMVTEDQIEALKLQMIRQKDADVYALQRDCFAQIQNLERKCSQDLFAFDNLPEVE